MFFSSASFVCFSVCEQPITSVKNKKTFAPARNGFIFAFSFLNKSIPAHCRGQPGKGWVGRPNPFGFAQGKPLTPSRHGKGKNSCFGLSPPSRIGKGAGGVGYLFPLQVSKIFARTPSPLF